MLPTIASEGFPQARSRATSQVGNTNKSDAGAVSEHTKHRAEEVRVWGSDFRHSTNSVNDPLESDPDRLLARSENSARTGTAKNPVWTLVLATQPQDLALATQPQALALANQAWAAWT